MNKKKTKKLKRNDKKIIFFKYCTDHRLCSQIYPRHNALYMRYYYYDYRNAIKMLFIDGN